MRTVALLLAALLPSAAHAQYARSAADTLRYHEVTSSTSVLATPMGEFTSRSAHDARVAVAFAAGDTARAWFEALAVSSASNRGVIRPDPRPLLGRPYLLSFDARGDVRTLAVPEFPAGFEEVGDLTHEFNDFFVPLPAAPLRAGAEWADTTRREATNAQGRTLRTTRAGRFRVRRDTMVAGERAWVIEARMNNRLESTGPAQGLVMASVLEGAEEGVILFAPGRGAVAGRRRTGTLAGQVEFRGGPQPVVIPHRLTYQSTIDLLPARR